MNDYIKLENALKKISSQTSLSSQQSSFFEKLLQTKTSEIEVIYLLSYKLINQSRIRFIYENVAFSSKKMKEVNDIRLSYLIEKFIYLPNLSVLEEIKITYTNLANFNERIYYRNIYYRNESKELPIEIAKNIMNDVMSYPRQLVSIAERSCRLFANKNIKMVGQIAKEDNWFE